MAVGHKKNIPGCGCCPTTPAGACLTYAVSVVDGSGAPVAGIAVTLTRAVGSTIAPVVGSTGDDGLFIYAMPTTGPGASQPITGATATIPLGGPAVPNNGAVRVGTVCTFRYRLCKYTTIIHTLDGDTDGPISGVNLNSHGCYECGPDMTGPTYTINGSIHTAVQYCMSSLSGTGAPLGTACHGTGIPGTFSCKPGYWGDCLPGPFPPRQCDDTYEASIYVWSRAKYNYNPATICQSSRKTVISKRLCLSMVAPEQVAGKSQWMLDWDSTSWDGCGNFADLTPSMYEYNDANGYRILMKYGGCFPNAGAVGSCQCGPLGRYSLNFNEAVDVPYASILVQVVFEARRAFGGSLYLHSADVAIVPCWDGNCQNSTRGPSCGCDILGVEQFAGPHLECRGPFIDSKFVDGELVTEYLGDVYYARMPSSLGFTWTASNIPGALTRFVGLYHETAKLLPAGPSYPFTWSRPTGFEWGCANNALSPDNVATVTLADGPDCGGSGPYETSDVSGPDEEDEVLTMLHPGPVGLLA